MVLPEENGLIKAFVLDGRGGGRSLAWHQISEWTQEQGLLWIHLNFAVEEAQQWLLEQSGLEPLVVHALIADETRPRSVSLADGVLISLRGVNNNPGADPEDMVSIRLFCSANRIISTRRRRLLSVMSIADDLEQGRGPCSAGELVATLANRLVDRMSGVINELEERIDEIEEAIIEDGIRENRSKLIELRREIIQLRRYLSPQREALAQMQKEPTPLFSAEDKLSIREASDKITRHIEDLDTCRDRAAVANEELTSRLNDQMNSRMYLLSLVAGLFLPLGFLTGLLGINVGGIPLAENPWGFFYIVIFILIVAVIQIVLFWRKRWF